MSDVSVNSTVVAAKEQVACDLAGEVVMLALKTGVYYGLDPIGAQIWKLVQEPRTVAVIRDAIVAEYEVSPEECERDLLELLQHMSFEGLVEITDAPAA